MGQDEGDDSSGFINNFFYGTLILANNTYVQLADLSDNAAGSETEAIYVNSLIVPAGTTLDLNGLNLYTRAAQIEGTITGGSVHYIPDSGSITIGSSTPGEISIAGEIDEWSFFARAGQSVTVTVDTGSSNVLTPKLSWGQIELVDSSDAIIADIAGTVSGQVVTLDDVAIPTDGTYRVRVKGPTGHISVTGNYQVTAWNVTADVSRAPQPATHRHD